MIGEHVFKASKTATIQEVLNIAKSLTGDQYPFIEMKEMIEDMGKDLLTVVARGIVIINQKNE